MSNLLDKKNLPGQKRKKKRGETNLNGGSGEWSTYNFVDSLCRAVLGKDMI